MRGTAAPASRQRRGSGRGVFACAARSGYDGGTFAGILPFGPPRRALRRECVPFASRSRP
ncbi:hypothetical protein BLAT2472_40366 [Burkholderia latens]